MIASSRRTFGRRLLGVLLGLLLGLVAAEVVVRVAGRAPEVSVVRRGRIQLSDDARLVFEPVPGMRVEGEAGLWEAWSGTANRLGYRDREHPLARPPGSFRIVVLGDSVAAGWGVRDTDDTFPFVLERRLRAAGSPVEVLSFAVTGYDTAQEVETLAARALPYHPDLVLLAYCLNDRRPPDPRIVAELRRDARRPGAMHASFAAGGLRALMLDSALYRWLRFVVLADRAEVPQVADEGFDPEARPPRPDQVHDRVRDGVPLAGPSAVATAFERLAGLQSAAGARGEPFRVVVTMFPYLRHLSRDQFRDQHRHVAGLAAEHGFAWLDLTAPLRGCAAASSETIAFDRYHPTAYGHRCVADALAGYLLNEKLVPRG